MFCRKLILLEEFNKIQPFKLEFKPLTVIVGDNGTGKSTVFKFINGHYDNNIPPNYKLDVDSVNSYFFDSETMNPRTIPVDKDNVQKFKFQVASHFTSKGQTLLQVFNILKTVKDSVILIDEPEVGISIKNQRLLISDMVKSVNENNNQIVIATHSYVMIKSVSEVFCMDTMKWMNSQEYLELSLNT